MPYIRTWNTKSIVDEIGIFIVAALLVTSIIFFFFFRSFRATFISMFVVIIGVMWAFGILGLLKYEMTILTALIPPLIIVIGIPNCIFLINKYQQEVNKHGNQALSLQRVISKIGNATLMTNITTASGFATFIILDSDLLREFGIVASINIVGIFVLSLLIIPIIYSFMPLPKTKHLKHLNKKWMDFFVNWMERMVRDHRIAVYMTTVAVLVLSLLISYQRAKAESLDLDAKGGLMERAERFIVLAIGLLFPEALIVVLWLMLVLSAITAVQRFVKVWRQASAERDTPYQRRAARRRQLRVERRAERRQRLVARRRAERRPR